MVIAPALVQAMVYVSRRVRGHHDGIEFRLLDEGLGFSTREMSRTIFWKSIKRVRSTGDRLFFFVFSRSAMIVPRRCFTDSERFDAWRRFSERAWAERKVAK